MMGRLKCANPMVFNSIIFHTALISCWSIAADLLYLQWTEVTPWHERGIEIGTGIMICKVCDF